MLDKDRWLQDYSIWDIFFTVYLFLSLSLGIMVHQKLTNCYRPLSQWKEEGIMRLVYFLREFQVFYALRKLQTYPTIKNGIENLMEIDL